MYLSICSNPWQIEDKAVSKVQGQYHAYPRVPVTAVSKAVQSKIAILIHNNYFPILVADGVHHPLKAGEHAKRRTRKM